MATKWSGHSRTQSLPQATITLMPCVFKESLHQMIKQRQICNPMQMVASAAVSNISVASLSSPSFGLFGSRKKSWQTGLHQQASLNPPVTLKIGEMKVIVQHTQPTGRSIAGCPKSREVQHSTSTNIDSKQVIKFKSSPTSIRPMFSSRRIPHWSSLTLLLRVLYQESRKALLQHL